MWETIFLAIALMLIIEGILPFLSPQIWRETFRRMMEANDSQIRFIGLSSMLIGLILLVIVS